MTLPTSVQSSRAPSAAAGPRRGLSAFIAHAAVASIASITLTTAAPGLEIVLDYKDGKSKPPLEDPDGAKLQAIVRAAADEWERVFASVDETVEINFFWARFPSAGGIVGDFTPRTPRTLAKEGPVALSGGKRRIRFDTFGPGLAPIEWFLDPTPGENEEFGQPRTVHYGPELGDDVETTLGLGFTGPWPSWVEVSRVAISTNPSVEDHWDLYSVALHAIGQSIGLNPNRIACGPVRRREGHLVPDQWFPGVSAFDPFLMKTQIGDFGPVRCDRIAEGSVMQNELQRGQRRFISAVDVMAIAAANDWPLSGSFRPYLDRAELMSLTSSGITNLKLNTRAPWLGRRVPGRDSDVFIRESAHQVVRFDDSFEFRSVEVSNLGTSPDLDLTDVAVETKNNRVSAVEDIFIHAGAGGTICVKVDSNGSLDGRRIIADDASIQVVGGGLLRGHGGINVRAGGWLRTFGAPDDYALVEATGEGLFISSSNAVAIYSDYAVASFRTTPGSRFSGGGTVIRGFSSLFNTGAIVAENGLLEFLPSGPAIPAQFGGQPAAEVLAIDGNIFVGPCTIAPFQGALVVGQHVILQSALPIAELGQLVLIPRDLLGSTVTALGIENAGTIQCFEDTLGFVHSPVTHEASGAMFAEIGGKLILNGPVEFRGGEVFGDGAIYTPGDIVVSSDQLIETASFVWDGERDGIATDPEQLTTVQPGRRFHIASSAISENPDDGYNGRIDLLVDSVLRVDIPWRIQGRLDLDGAIVRGGELRIDSLLRGHGIVEAPVVNDGLILGPPVGSGKFLILAGGLVSLPGSSVVGNVIVP